MTLLLWKKYSLVETNLLVASSHSLGIWLTVSVSNLAIVLGDKVHVDSLS